MKKNRKFSALRFASVALALIIIATCFSACTRHGDEGEQTEIIADAEVSVTSLVTYETEVTTEKTEAPTETFTKPTTAATTAKTAPTTKVQTTKDAEPATEKQVKYTAVNQTVYATVTLNVRSTASTSSLIIGQLKKGTAAKRTAIGDNGWSKIVYNGKTYFAASRYLTTAKPVAPTTTKAFTTTTVPVTAKAPTTTKTPTTNTTTEAPKIKNIKTAKVGDIVIYGLYEQNNDKSDGPEDIEWIVLAKENDKILLISKYVLDSQLFNEEDDNVTWETCTMRTWLNTTFLNNAFSDAEQKKIITSDVVADENFGNATKDKIFILSSAEAEKYFATDMSRRCAPTKYAIARGIWRVESVRIENDFKTESGEDTCCYWLRSPGFHNAFAAMVDYEGTVYRRGCYVDEDAVGVRPALWLTLQ